MSVAFCGKIILRKIWVVCLILSCTHTVFAEKAVNEVGFSCPETELIDVQATFLPCSDTASTVTLIVSSVNAIVSYSIDGGITAQSSPTFFDLPSGNYLVAVTNSLNCTISFPFTVFNPDLPVFSSFEVKDASCTGNNGVIDFEVNGGSPPYLDSIEANGSGIFYPLLSDSTAGYTAGTYQIIVEDNNGCRIDTTFTLLDYDFPIIDEIILTNPACNESNGSIEITLANPPVGNYSTAYSINGGALWQSSNEFNDLPAGQYIVYALVDGCLSGMGFPLFVDLTETTGIEVTNLVITPTDCGASNGSISISGTNTNGPLSYSIDGGLTSSTTNLFENLQEGFYTISLVDIVNGCQLDTTLFLAELAGPVISSSIVTQADCGINNGQINVVATIPGSSLLVYTIDFGVTSQSDGIFSNLSPNTYTVTVENNFGCVTDVVLTLLDNSPPIVNGGADLEVCSGSSVILAGTVSPNSELSWNNGVTNNVGFTPTESGIYEITAVSQNGCIATDEVVITVLQTITPEIYINFTQECIPVNVNIGLLNSGFTNCIWTVSNGYVNNSCSEQTILFSSQGCFDLELTTTDANGCNVIYSMNDAVCIDPGPEADFTYSPSTISTEDSFIQLLNTSENATSYQWELLNDTPSSEENPSSVLSGIPGTYPVQLIANNELGCSDTTILFITIDEVFSYFIPNSFTPDGDEFNQTFLPVLTNGFNPSDYSLLIFNRWGQIVFESKNTEIGWDGTFDGEIVPVGTYTYQLRASLIKNADVINYTGHVTVLK
jgi:gliding motility-associated-like protein